ncbi:MAG: hypothetical protein JRG94_10610 [Deltaproteobacteria bacterium]|nr:hypothetical protein [Deltaproteobacteria bacterium]
MNMRGVRGLLLMVGWFVAVSLNVSAAQDPANLVSAGNFVVDPGQDIGQSFQMRLSGRLTGIEIAPMRDSAGPDDLIVLEVFNGTSQSLGSVSITAGGFPPGAGVPVPLVLGVVGPGFFDLTPLAIDVSENDGLSFELRKISSGSIRVGLSTDVYGDGTAFVNGAPFASLDLTFKIYLTPIPKLLVGASNGQNVKAFDSTNGAVQGDFTSGAPTTLGPHALAIGGPMENLYVGGWSSRRVDEFDVITGEFVGTIISASGIASTSTITFGPDGHLYVTDFPGGISRWNVATGSLIGSFVAPGSGGLRGIGGMRFGPDGHLYVGSMDAFPGIHEVLRFDGTTGAPIDVFVSSGSGGLTFPDDLLFGPAGDLYVTSRDTNNVLRYDGTTGAFLEVFASGSGLEGPSGLTFGPDNHLYVSSGNPDEILRFDGSTGAFIDVFASSGMNPAPTFLLFTEGELPPTPPVIPVPALGPAGLGLVVVVIVGLGTGILWRREQMA